MSANVTQPAETDSPSQAHPLEILQLELTGHPDGLVELVFRAKGSKADASRLLELLAPGAPSRPPGPPPAPPAPPPALRHPEPARRPWQASQRPPPGDDPPMPDTSFVRDRRQRGLI